jgi:hypothetical protein
VSVGPPSAAESSTADGIAALLPSWRRSLAARRVSPRTIATYATSAAQLADYLAGRRHAHPRRSDQARARGGVPRGSPHAQGPGRLQPSLEGVTLELHWGGGLMQSATIDYANEARGVTDIVAAPARSGA